MLNTSSPDTVDVWIHAVSLGEVIAATPLISAMLQEGWKVLVTTTTPTGSQRVIQQFNDSVVHQYLPYDLPLLQKRFFRRYRPRLGVIMETELWPNTINQAEKAGIALLLVNARLSERSMKGYLRAAFFFKKLLHQFTSILTQSDEDKRRFLKLGASEDKVQTMGNIKFDLQKKITSKDIYQTLQNYWGKERPVLIAASTHDNEEAQVLSHLRVLQQGIKHLVLLIAPRHPERFHTVYAYCKQQGFRTGLRSQSETLTPECEVVILDSLGELLGWYGISDYAFVGGSFVPVGGHNVLEPIAMQVPVFTGPHIHNFKTICRELEAHHALQIVESPQALVSALIALSADEQARLKQVKEASKILEENKGALDFCFREIRRTLQKVI